jgi:hypothetical protein
MERGVRSPPTPRAHRAPRAAATVPHLPHLPRLAPAPATVPRLPRPARAARIFRRLRRLARAPQIARRLPRPARAAPASLRAPEQVEIGPLLPPAPELLLDSPAPRLADAFPSLHARRCKLATRRYAPASMPAETARPALEPNGRASVPRSTQPSKRAAQHCRPTPRQKPARVAPKESSRPRPAPRTELLRQRDRRCDDTDGSSAEPLDDRVSLARSFGRPRAMAQRVGKTTRSARVVFRVWTKRRQSCGATERDETFAADDDFFADPKVTPRNRFIDAKVRAPGLLRHLRQFRRGGAGDDPDLNDRFGALWAAQRSLVGTPRTDRFAEIHTRWRRSGWTALDEAIDATRRWASRGRHPTDSWQIGRARRPSG